MKRSTKEPSSPPPPPAAEDEPVKNKKKQRVTDSQRDSSLLIISSGREAVTKERMEGTQKLPISRLLSIQGIHSTRISATPDALAVFQAGMDIFACKLAASVLLYVGELEDLSVKSLAATGGGPYLARETKATGDGTVIYPRHVVTALDTDKWTSAMLGSKIATPSEVHAPCITMKLAKSESKMNK